MLCFVFSFLFWLLKAENGRRKQKHADGKTGKTTYHTAQENVHDALVHNSQHANVALLVPLVGGLLLVLLTGHPPQGPADQPQVRHVDEETRVNNVRKTYKKKQTVTSNTLKIMHHTLALVSEYKGNTVMPSTQRYLTVTDCGYNIIIDIAIFIVLRLLQALTIKPKKTRQGKTNTKHDPKTETRKQHGPGK